MKFFVIACFTVLLMIGAALFAQLQYEQVNEAEIDSYLSSRGATAVPNAWKSEIGKGI